MSSTFCHFRWSDTVVNLRDITVRSCCKTKPHDVSLDELNEEGTEIFSNSRYLKKRRQEMIDGLKHSDCSYCWELEDKNIYHTRMRSKSFKSFKEQIAKHSPNETDDLFEATEILHTKNLDSLEIVLENTCQMKCLYCSPEFSSAWEAEVQMGRTMPSPAQQNLKSKFKEKFFEYLPEAFDGLKNITLLGGEPLIQPDFYKMLDQIATLSSKSPSPEKKLEINVISNLSVPPLVINRFLDKVEKMNSLVDIILLPSIENTGEQAEYLRFGLNWNYFLDNLEKSFNSGLFPMIRILTTLNLLSVTGLRNLLGTLFELKKRYPKQSLQIIPNIVKGPTHLSPLLLDSSFVFYLQDSIDFLQTHEISDQKNQNEYIQFLEGIRNNLASQQSPSYLRNDRIHFCRWIVEMDKKRNTHFLKTYPEYETLLNRWQRLDMDPQK